MTPLNLPPIEAKVKTENGRTKIWDGLRRRYVALTPEEWVRQHFVGYLVGEKGYTAALMANEVRIELNGMSRRCDTVVYRRDLMPRVIIEYKRPDVKITQRVFSQICRYNLVMQVDYLIVSNGLEHYCCRMNYAQQTYEFLDDIPNFQAL
jgi:predicted type IV restriction endonuclease